MTITSNYTLPPLPVQQTPKAVSPGQGMTNQTPTVTRAEIDWAVKFDKKMVLGWIPSAEDQAKYNQIINGLQSIRNGGGYVYQDTADFSNNPRGFASIGSIIGRTLSGGYVGYQYGGQMGQLTKTTYQNTKNSFVNGEIGSGFKNLAIGLKDMGVVSVKAGAISSALNATISFAANTAEVVSGRQTGKEAMGNVAADTVGGFLSGVGAAGFAGFSSLGFAVAGVSGLPLTLATVAGGAVGSVLMDMAYKGSGLFTVIKNRISSTLD